MKKRVEKRSRAPNVIKSVRQSAKYGAASRVGGRRLDVIEEIASIVVQKYWMQLQQPNRPISNPTAWAFKVGQNEAQAWMEQEKKTVSMDAGFENTENHGEQSPKSETLAAEQPKFQGQDEVLEALPELFDWFYSNVVHRLDKDDQLFFKRFYLDRWPEELLASEFHISKKAVAQRWRRMLLRIRRTLRTELPHWEHGNDLFGEAFRDPKSLVDLLCLIRLYVEEGIQAIRDIIQSFRQD